MGFSPINTVHITKPILSVHADKVRLSAHEDKDCFPDKPTLAVRTDNMGLSDKPDLSERNPLYLQIMWGFFFREFYFLIEPTLPDKIM